MCTTIFQVGQNTKLQKGTEFLRMISVVLFALWLHISGAGNLIAYTWIWIGWVAIGIIFGWFFLYKSYYLPYLKDAQIIYDKDLTKEVIRYSLWVVLAANVGTILGQIDMQLIIYLLWTRDAWYYTNYLSIIWIPFIIITPIIGFIFPVISELHSKWAGDKITTIKNLFYKYFAVLGIITGMFMFVFGPTFAYILFWEKFLMSWVIVQYSAFFLVLNFLLTINFQILAWVGRIRERVKILGIGLIFNICLNILLIHLYGVVGSALAVGLSWIPIWYLSDRATRMYSHGFDLRFFTKNLILTVIIGIWSWIFILPLFEWIWRMYWFFLLGGIGMLTIAPFILLNLREGRMFLQEIKKIKK
jgi:O-antigen/teichoic acid export membrane protein